MLDQGPLHNLLLGSIYSFPPVELTHQQPLEVSNSSVIPAIQYSLLLQNKPSGAAHHCYH